MAESSGDEDCGDVDFVFYCDREEWKDITPVEQDDGPYPVVRIAYSAKCGYLSTDIEGYLRLLICHLPCKNEFADKNVVLLSQVRLCDTRDYTVHYS